MKPMSPTVESVPEMTLDERLARTCADFQAEIDELARTYRKAKSVIYAWWLEYCEDCRNYDQSPVMSEFVVWYRSRLEEQP